MGSGRHGGPHRHVVRGQRGGGRRAAGGGGTRGGGGGAAAVGGAGPGARPGRRGGRGGAWPSTAPAGWWAVPGRAPRGGPLRRLSNRFANRKRTRLNSRQVA